MPNTSKIKNSLAGQIKQRRMHNGLTQRELADFAGLSLVTINHSERGDVKIETMYEILNALNRWEDK